MSEDTTNQNQKTGQFVVSIEISALGLLPDTAQAESYINGRLYKIVTDKTQAISRDNRRYIFLYRQRISAFDLRNRPGIMQYQVILFSFLQDFAQAEIGEKVVFKSAGELNTHPANFSEGRYFFGNEVIRYWERIPRIDFLPKGPNALPKLV